VQDEADALLRVLLKFAPAEGYSSWVDHALEKCAYQMKTRAWPTQGELGAVCSNIRKETPSAPLPVTDDVERMASRIRQGMPVGDGWLYGRGAVEMINRGLVTESDLSGYRSGLFFEMREVWGEAQALAREEELWKRHEDVGGTRPRRVAA
jgi:hypothetical protein